MKKVFAILFLILLAAFAASAQLSTPPLWVANNPAFCTPTRFNTALVYNYTVKKLYKCSTTNNWTEIGGGASIGGAVTSGTTGSVLFVNSSGNLAQSNSSFYFDSSLNRLKLGESSYVGTSGGWNAQLSSIQVGFDTAVTDNTLSVFGGLFDMKRSQTSGTGQQTSGVRMRCHLVQTGGTGGTCTGTESFVRNLGSTVTTTLMQGVEGIAQVEENATLVYGGYFQSANTSGGAGTAVNTLAGVRANVVGATGWTNSTAVVFDGYSITSGATVTNLYGLRLSGWSGTGVVNSYGIYADTSIDRGGTLKYFIYSLSTSPSLFTGSVSGPLNAYDATSWNGSAKFATEDAVRDKIESIGGASAPLTLTNTVASDIPLSIVGASAQSGNYFNVTTNGGTAGDVFKIASNGFVTVNGRINITGTGNYFANGDNQVGDVLATGQQVIGYGGAGIILRDNSGSRGFLVGGAAVASAASIQPTGTLFHVTGTTNITSMVGTIGGWPIIPGTEVTIIFDGVLTFTDGSNLKLNGNFVTTADDTITLKFDGTNWYEVGRSPN
jgi:hypothetical protein